MFIIAITGCIYAFQVEIQNITQPYRFVEQEGKTLLPPSKLKAIAENELPQKKIHAVLYAGKVKAAQAIFYNFEPDYYYYLVYLNPYNGEVLKVKNMEEDFFRFILNGHFYLWLPPAIGQPVVATATLIFVIMLISGLFLWWPRNKSAARQRFSIKWNARWRRKNYDLHNVLGFYVISIALILALTGLVWGFQWFKQAVYQTAGGEKSLVYVDPASDVTADAEQTLPPIDKVWVIMKKEYPTAASLEVHIPESDTSSIAANANPEYGTYWQTDYRYFDQYTLEELEVDHIYGRFHEAKTADKLLRMNYDIHVGAIFGLPGKILMFFTSLIIASLPVSGFYIWWGRRKKSKNRKVGSGNKYQPGKKKLHPRLNNDQAIPENITP